MGLDITAYRNLKVVENVERDEDGCLVDWELFEPGASMEWSEKHFPGRGEGIESDKVYRNEENLSFRAGSYSGYNWWRAKLEEFSKGICFQELINFADNEGVIGPIVSKKLLQDFRDNKDKALEYSKSFECEGEWWFAKYCDWEKAFEYASENGAVEFR